MSESCDREKPSFPTCHTSKDAFLKIKELVQDLPVDGIGVNDVVARVKWLVEKVKSTLPGPLDWAACKKCGRVGTCSVGIYESCSIHDQGDGTFD